MRSLRLQWRGKWNHIWLRNSTVDPPERVFFNPQSGEITDLHPILTFSPEEQAADELITETDPTSHAHRAVPVAFWPPSKNSKAL